MNPPAPDLSGLGGSAKNPTRLFPYAKNAKIPLGLSHKIPKNAPGRRGGGAAKKIRGFIVEETGEKCPAPKNLGAGSHKVE